MAKVIFKEVNKIFNGTVPAEKKWYEFWKPSLKPQDVHIVKNLSMEVNDGEFLVLVGPSGCGKSTTLRMLAGLEEITSGEIYIDDKLVNDISPKDRDIAMVFQNYALYPHMNVYENMAFSLKLRKFDKKDIDKMVDEAAELLGIEELLKRKPKELSGGQRQRVAMGRAIVRKPKVFLMDEPLSNLDAKLRVQMRAELQKLHQRLGVTTIYVTHDQTEAMTLGSRIALLNNGLIQQLDNPLNMYELPKNKFVAGFIGSPAMNFIDAKIEKDGEDIFINSSGFRIKFNNSRIAPYAGKDVVVGIRPENIKELGNTKVGDITDSVSVLVDVIESMGSEAILYLSSGKDTLVARVEPHTKARVGENLNIAFDAGKVHIFDKETEQNLTVPF